MLNNSIFDNKVLNTKRIFGLTVKSDSLKWEVMGLSLTGDIYVGPAQGMGGLGNGPGQHTIEG